jgi:hypothetical protein
MSDTERLVNHFGEFVEGCYEMLAGKYVGLLGLTLLSG